MHKIILFRGGMCGDIILSMIDKSYTRNLYPLENIKQRYVMKKFYNYTEKEKLEYYESFNQNKTEYTISHDTDFCFKPEIRKNVIQIYCSDEKMVPFFSKRFWIKNDFDEISHVIKKLDSTDKNKIKDYANDIISWQNFYKFPNTFDVKNVYTPNFINELKLQFEIRDLDWAKTIHAEWLTQE